MPRRNPGRKVTFEAAVAERVAYEREIRGWSLEGLAKRMTVAGCPINQSAIHKIENGEPRRRITVDELCALGVVLGMPIEELIKPMAVVADARARQLWEDWRCAHVDRNVANQRVFEVEIALSAHALGHPAAAKAIKEEIDTILGDENPTSALLYNSLLHASETG